MHYSKNPSLNFARPLPCSLVQRRSNHLQLNSNSKYNIHLKHHLNSCVQKIRHTGACLEINTTLGFVSCCINLLTCPLIPYFLYSTCDGALSNYVKNNSMEICYCSVEYMYVASHQFTVVSGFTKTIQNGKRTEIQIKA